MKLQFGICSTEMKPAEKETRAVVRKPFFDYLYKRRPNTKPKKQLKKQSLSKTNGRNKTWPLRECRMS